MRSERKVVPDNHFTPTQQAMLDVLAGGRPHTRDELHACLPDELGEANNVHAHLSAIRKRLRSKGEDIVCRRLTGVPLYTWVRLVAVGS